MEHPDHSRFHHLRVRHDSVLQIDARDPFAAALHQILRAVHDLDVAFSIDGCHVAGPEPAVHESVVAARVVVVAAGNPRPANLQFAHGAFRPRPVLHLSRPRFEYPLQPAAIPCRASMSKRSLIGQLFQSLFSVVTVAIGVVSVMPHASMKSDSVFFLVQFDELPRQRGARHDHCSKLEISCGCRFQIICINASRCRHARGERDAFVLDQSARCRRAAAWRPLNTMRDAGHDAGKRDAPAVGMKHRTSCRMVSASLRRKTIRHADSIAVQE